MAYENKCPFCGFYLDYGEKCDCREEKKQKLEKMESLLSSDSDGQIKLRLENINEA